MHDLALQIGQIDAVAIADRQRADARGGKVQRRRRTQPAGADHQYMRIEQALLAFDADFRQQDVPAVAQQLFVVHGAVSYFCPAETITPGSAGRYAAKALIRVLRCPGSSGTLWPD